MTTATITPQIDALPGCTPLGFKLRAGYANYPRDAVRRAIREAREIAHAMIAGLVERGLGFAASYSAGSIVIRLNGGV